MNFRQTVTILTAVPVLYILMLMKGGEKYEVQSYKVQSCETCRFYNKELYWCDRLNDTTYKPNCSSYQAIE